MLFRSYCPAHVDRHDVNPRPLSSLVPSSGLCGAYSADRTQIIALAWEPYQEIFQGVIACLHNDFRIGGLAAGETKTIRGKIYFVRADEKALVARFERDFPEQAAKKSILSVGKSEPSASRLILSHRAVVEKPVARLSEER